MKIILAIVLLTLCSPGIAFDLVVNNGRVMDPESGLDAVRHLAIEDGKIVRISTGQLQGDSVIDASGLIVSPGFIDLHAHGEDAVSNRFQAADGVTTALELEIGVYPIAPWYESRKGASPINYGASVSHPWVRGTIFAAAKGGEVSQAEAFQLAARTPRVRPASKLPCSITGPVITACCSGWLQVKG